MRFMGPLCAGMSPLWWSDKHNKHHALTNEIGVDEDIATDPVLFVRAPDPKNDSWHRRIQHLTAFVIWRMDSIKVLWKELRKKKPRKGAVTETVLLAAHWSLVFALIPWHIIPAYILLSGLITAIITTATHQSEEMFEDFNPDFVDNQFRSTRDATVRNPFGKWLWGGMQYQLEHHLFPSMPRSKYPALQPILKKFAEVNKVPGGDDGGTCLEGLVQGLRSRNGLSCQGLRLLGGWATTRGFRFQNPQGLAAFYAGGVLSSPSFPTSVRGEQ
ncbi:Delta(6)-fatty-acid desaturase fat-3 (FAT-3) (Delta(6)-fatty-acid desaturase) (Ceeld6) (Fatty acid desaturase 3) [Durusdinium trenchii]|uniref:Delta(6)-fatty-acid desaturase fat-3 (FAT-3) (Delta(6)-fatty-acid desaturase) (Ceeld6) (Fatty acid desaturase 3) n=1 Tax=Durusdinium trenchii TaxID=1381693 RepID=A0ABP0LBH2_9DINO